MHCDCVRNQHSAFIHSYVIITTMPNQVVYLKNITKIFEM